MTDKIAQKILLILKRTFSYLSLPQQKSLSYTIAALFNTPSFSLYNIASHLPIDTSNKHKHKHLIRFLDTLSIDTNFWKSYITTIFCLPYLKIRRRKFITLLLDATTLKDDLWILSASISYEGRAIPIYMEMWKGVNVSYNYWERVIGFVKNMRALLPDKYSYIIVADRGFQGTTLPKTLKKLKIDYIIRINDSYHIKVKSGKEWTELSLLDVGKYEDVELGKSDPMIVPCVVVNEIRDVEEGKEKRWYLMSSKKEMSREEIVDIYAKRMWIEESFKDLKGVLKWEDYTKNMASFERIRKMLVISGLSYGIQMSIGSSRIVKEQKGDKESIMRGLKNFLNSVSSKIQRGIMIFVVLTIQNIQGV